MRANIIAIKITFLVVPAIDAFCEGIIQVRLKLVTLINLGITNKGIRSEAEAILCIRQVGGTSSS